MYACLVKKNSVTWQTAHDFLGTDTSYSFVFIVSTRTRETCTRDFGNFVDTDTFSSFVFTVCTRTRETCTRDFGNRFVEG
jgi:hypothetical protein